METIVISLGGSVLCPDSLDMNFAKKVIAVLKKNKQYHFVIVTGGGKLARNYIDQISKVTQNQTHKDLIGIAATRVHAQAFASICDSQGYKINVVTSPSDCKGNCVLGGTEPGHSTDFVAVQCALKVKAKKIINISNIDYIYNSDPKAKNAKAIHAMDWQALQNLVGIKFSPGLHAPFDPKATALAKQSDLVGYFIGKDPKTLEHVIQGKKAKGTIVGGWQ